MAKDNSLVILTHILGLFVGFLGPLIILLSSDDKEVKRHSKIALNWQFSFIVYFIVSIILMFVLIGFLTLLTIAILNTVFCIVATVKASEGKVWEYPLSIRFFDIRKANKK
jgi:uncharacterized Tic20 family protein